MATVTAPEFGASCDSGIPSGEVLMLIPRENCSLWYNTQSNWLSPRLFAENERRKIDVAFFSTVYKWHPPRIDDELCKRSYHHFCIGIRIVAAVYANSFVRAREEHSTNVEN